MYTYIYEYYSNIDSTGEQQSDHGIGLIFLALVRFKSNYVNITIFCVSQLYLNKNTAFNHKNRYFMYIEG